MSPFEIVQSVMGFLPAIILCIAVTSMLHFTRRNKILYFLGYLVIGIALELIFDLWLRWHIANMILQNLLFILLAVFLSDDTLPRRIVAPVLAIVVMQLAEMLGSALCSTLGGSMSDDGFYILMTDMWVYVICSLVVSLTFGVLIFITVIIWNRVLKKDGSMAMAWFVLFPVSQMFLLWWGVNTVINLGGDSYYYTVFAALGLIGLFADVVMLVAVRKLMDSAAAKEKARFMEEQVARQQSYYERMLRDAEHTTKLRHDIRNQLQTAYILLDEGRETEARAQLDGINAGLSATEPVCQNTVVDAIMRDKSAACAEKNIALQCDISIDRDCPIGGVELCSVFANIMDNAINACVSGAVGEPYINIKASEQSGFLVVYCQNSSEPPKKKEKRTLASLHGWGLTILSDIAEKYEGRLETDAEEDSFAVTLWLKTRKD